MSHPISSTHSSPNAARRRERGSTGRPAQRGAGRAGRGGSGWSRHGTALPDWSDLESGNRYRTDEGPSFLQRVSTIRFAFLVLVLAGGFTLYVGHVHATGELLTRVQEARVENQRLHLKRNRLQGAYDRKTRPDVIYERARELGLEASTSYGPTVHVE